MARSKISGIYQILNIRTGKSYIGSSVDMNRRWNQHKLELSSNKHSNQKLQRSWNKHGPEAFEFRKVIECSKEHLIEAEKYWIKYLSCEYNIQIPIENGWKFSSESIAKRSAIAKSKVNTSQFKKFQEASRLAKIGSKRPDTTVTRMQASARKRPIQGTSEKGTLISFDSFMDAQRAGFVRGGIDYAIRHKTKYRDFYWSYKND